MKFKLSVIILIFLIFLTISIIVIFAKPQNLLSRYRLFGNIYNNSKLTVLSDKAALEVFVDGESFGDTPVNALELKEGPHEIVLKRISSDTTDKSAEQKFYIDMYKGTESVVDIELLPNSSYAGFVIYYTKAPSNKDSKGFITLTGAHADSTVSFDNETFAPDKIKNFSLDAKSYDVTIEAEGYESLQFPIVVREGYNLNIKASLLTIPIKF